MALPLIQNTSNTSLKSLAEDGHVKGSPKDKKDIQLELPINFDEVAKGVYRSSLPHPRHFPALKKLRLKTIITLVDEPYTYAHEEFIRENNITHHRILVQAHKDPNTRNPDKVFNDILKIILNPVNHPILVHCNKGKHRTGCTIACFRKTQKWAMSDIIAEYRKYSFPKSRDLDERFIFDFDISNVARLAEEVNASAWGLSDLAKSHLRAPSSVFDAAGMF